MGQLTAHRQFATDRPASCSTGSSFPDASPSRVCGGRSRPAPIPPAILVVDFIEHRLQPATGHRLRHRRQVFGKPAKVPQIQQQHLGLAVPAAGLVEPLHSLRGLPREQQGVVGGVVTNTLAATWVPPSAYRSMRWSWRTAQKELYIHTVICEILPTSMRVCRVANRRQLNQWDRDLNPRIAIGLRRPA